MSKQNKGGLQLHEIWRQGYRNRPYLANASDEALAARFQDIVGNSLTLTKNGKIGLHPIDREGEYWMTLFTHLLEEYEARGHRLPSISDYSIPVPTVSIGIQNYPAIGAQNCPVYCEDFERFFFLPWLSLKR